MVAVETSKLLLITCQPTHPGMGGQALAGSRSGDTHKHAVRGVSLPDEVVELGVWAVLAVAFPPLPDPHGEEGDGVGNVSETARKKIAQRYMPGLDTLLDGAVRLRNEVREHMGLILRKLRGNGGFVEFVAMFDCTLGAPVLVVHFLAMLELAREHLLEMTQAEAFAPIYVRLVDGRSESRSEQHSEPTE